MKYLIHSILAGLASVALFAGCAQNGFLARNLLRPIVVTNSIPSMVFTNTTIVTNLVTMPAVTNTVGFTNYVTPSYVQEFHLPVNTVQTLPAHTEVVTNGFTTAPQATESIEAVGAVANIFAPGIGSAVAAGLIAALTGFSAYQNKQIGNQDGANKAMSKTIEQVQVALKSSPNPTLVKAGGLLMDVLGSHADNATAGVQSVLKTLADSHGDSSAVIAMNQSARHATAEDLMAAATSGTIPDWFSESEKAAVAKIKA